MRNICLLIYTANTGLWIAVFFPMNEYVHKSLTHPTALVVEDEDVARRALVNLLNSIGYDAAGAASGEEALKMKRALSPTVVLVDFNLPGMDGLEFIAQMRKLDREFFSVL